jgi:hypothetical protein
MFISPKYRTAFIHLWNLAKAFSQRIFLSATMPVATLHRFMEIAALEVRFTRFVRGATNRPEIRYHAVRVDPKKRDIHSVVANLARALQKAYFATESRGIVFASTVGDAKAVGAELDAFQHHSQLSPDDKKENMRRWTEGVKLGATGALKLQPWMVATPGLINGLDMDRVDGVIFEEEGMAGMYGGVQGSGRGGRTGHPCMCFFVTTGTFNPKVPDDDPALTKVMAKWTREDKCLRLTPSEVMDGVPVTCESLSKVYSNTQFCSHCKPNTDMTRLVERAIESAAKPSHTTDMTGYEGFDDLPLECFVGQAAFDSFSSDFTAGLALTPAATQIEDEPIGDLVTGMSRGPPSSYPIKESERLGTPLLPSASAPSVLAVRNIKGKGVAASPSMPIRMNAALAQGVDDEKLRKTAILDRLIDRIRGYCYSCYILTGQYKPKDHERIIGCKVGATFGMGWQNFKKSWISDLQNFHFCRSCGMPQDVQFKSFGPSSHLGFGKNCNIQDMIPTMIFAIKRHPATWAMVAKATHLPITMTDEDFADWVKIYTVNTSKYYNGLELVIWIIEHVLRHEDKSDL